MKYAHIALFIIYLVIMIPIYSASVFASLSNVYAKGSNGINGYVKSEDYIDFKVTAVIDGDSDINDSQVKLSPTMIGFTCNPGLTGFDCTLRYPSSGTTSFSQTTPYTIKLYKDDESEEATATGELTADTLSPAVTSFTVSPQTTGTGTVSLDITINDYASVSGDTTKCSGIKKVEIVRSDGGVADTKTIDNSSCIVNIIAAYTTTKSSGSETICARAYDRVNQNSTLVCDDFNIDRLGPAIMSNSFKIIDSNGNDVSYIGTEPIGVTVSVNITEAELNTGSVKANLSGLNTDVLPTYNNMQGTCSYLGSNVTECSWPITLRLDSSGAKKVTVNASDMAGNYNVVALSKLCWFKQHIYS